MQLLILLLLAHLLGDFVFQPIAWVENKSRLGIRSPFLYFHVGIHAILLLILLRFESQYLPIVLWVGLSHLIIDLLKGYATGVVNKRWLFALDQILHLIVLGLCTAAYFPDLFDLSTYQLQYILVLSTTLLLATVVSSVVMSVFISKWRIMESDTRDSLRDAGKYIGMLERSLIVCFVLFQRWEAVGFLIAAKSVFRFSDLSRAKDRKLTEYILIGTLLSIVLAIATGLTAKFLIAQLPFRQ